MASATIDEDMEKFVQYRVMRNSLIHFSTLAKKYRSLNQEGTFFVSY